MLIKTDEELVRVVDDLMYRLKPITTELGLDLRRRLCEFVAEHGLDWDQHNFARLPESKDA